ncbi:45 kDa calcium-binding protein-like isoform X1 [Mercenaria mercenaria]|uniref:45 kDa calcium-binding protein-like isoform X1 n=1 Tax=Mercenaria mercenaria TaxID=6596 RepID=UPI00234F2F12|nr:45 kDa calcium-binding protein-like isoform X1 [Mercenaria mercenaria]XP_053379839.1 45 kDa calcium-binding protein-like isoform X1 [Mercenaria mercenaria]
MKASKITVCWLLTMSISGVFMAPPRNVIQMEEKAVDNMAAAPAKTRTTLKIELKQPEAQVEKPKNVPVEEKSKIEALNIPTQKRLSVEELKPADHLDAVKLEQDGMINKDYKKEIFIGNHEEIEDESLEVAESKLKDIFAKVDKDSDNKLCMAELEGWIIDKTQEHFDEALQENDHIFKHMDPDGDGFVDWKEYYVHFLLAKGHPIEKAKKHVKDYDEIELDYEEREQLIKYKFKWTDADMPPMDNKLTKEEFLAFRHPEQSEQALHNMVKTIMESLDKNDDKILTEEEFVSLPLGDVDDEEQRRLDKEWQKERGEEFRNQIDFDHNGKVTIGELKRYIDPRNPDNAKSDTKTLLEEMDDDKDKCISWKEIEDHKDMFIQSKIVNMRRILHDEF